MAEPFGSDQDQERTTKAIFFRWEKLRILYNAFLVLTVIATLVSLGRLSFATNGRFVFGAALRAVGANVCFTMAPVLEAYANWMGFRHRFLSPLLFSMGLLLSVAMTIGSVALFVPCRGD